MKKTNYKIVFTMIFIYWASAVLIFMIHKSFGVALLIIAAAFTIVISLKNNIFHIIFLLSLMIGGFVSFQVSGGFLKISHILSIFIFIFIIMTIKIIFNLLRSNIVLCLLFWILWTCFTTALSSTNYIDSLRTLSLPLVLILISINTAAILVSKKISIEQVIRIVIYAFITNIIIGYMQYFGYFIFGKNIMNFTETQWINISIANRMSSTFYEADTYGKYLMYIILLLAPWGIHLWNRNNRKYMFFIAVALVTLALNMTRSALIGLFGGISLITASSSILIKKKVVFMLLIASTLFVSLHILERYEVKSLFIKRLQSVIYYEIIREDPSVRYRIMTVERTAEIMNKDPLSWVLGMGWADWEEIIIGGANMYIFIILNTGLIGLAIFIYILFLSAKSLFLYQAQTDIDKMFSKGAGVTIIAMSITSLIASMWIDPLLWMTIGFGIYFELEKSKSIKPCQVSRLYL